MQRKPAAAHIEVALELHANLRVGCLKDEGRVVPEMIREVQQLREGARARARSARLTNHNAA